MLTPDNDDCLSIPGLPLAGVAIHTFPVWWSFDLAGLGDSEGRDDSVKPGGPGSEVRS